MRTPAALLLALFTTITLSAQQPQATGAAQHNLAAFSIWKPKEDQGARFEAGYKQHLKWHLAAGDRWNWYGWFIVSGPRDGEFLDATFGHDWSDLDHRVDPAGDGADNDVHTEPFADFLTGYKARRLPFSDTEDSTLLGAKYLRMLTINTTDPTAAASLISASAAALHQKGRKLLVYEMVDGGSLLQFIVLIGANSFTEFGQSTDWPDQLLALDSRNAKPVITGITAETLVFRRDLSILP